MIDELLIQTHITSSFWYDICVNLHSKFKNYWSYTDVIHIEWLLYSRRCLFSVLELDVRHDWWVMAPSTHCSFFLISHLCVLTHITRKLQVMYGRSAYQMTVLLSETFLVWFRVAREIQLLKNYIYRELQPQTHIGHSLMQIVCILQAHIYIAIWQTTTHDNKTHIPNDCLLHTKWQLYCQQYILL